VCDPQLAAFLTRLNLQHYISTFAREEMQLEWLLMEEEPQCVVAKIIPALGPQLRICSALKELKKQQTASATSSAAATAAAAAAAATTPVIPTSATPATKEL
jgi:hypothetical protein